jgi:hypothetical protein
LVAKLQKKFGVNIDIYKLSSNLVEEQLRNIHQAA